MFRLFTQYWRSITSAFVALLLVIMAVAGYYYTQRMKQESHLSKASYHYEQLTQEIAQNPNRGASDKATTFIKEYSNTPYPALLQLQLAAQAVSQSQLQEAFQWLKAAANEAQDPDIRSTAIQRGARVLAAMGQLEEALKFLDSVTEEAYISQAEELRGDIFNILKDKEKALESYQKSIKTDPELSAIRPLLQMKINELSHLEKPTS